MLVGRVFPPLQRLPNPPSGRGGVQTRPCALPPSTIRSPKPDQVIYWIRNEVELHITPAWSPKGASSRCVLVEAEPGRGCPDLSPLATGPRRSRNGPSGQYDPCGRSFALARSRLRDEREKSAGTSPKGMPHAAMRCASQKSPRWSAGGEPP